MHGTFWKELLQERLIEIEATSIITLLGDFAAIAFFLEKFSNTDLFSL